MCYTPQTIQYSRRLGRKEGEMAKFNAVKVFSATKAKEREALGDVITKWIAANPGMEIVDYMFRQSSDNEYHCVTLIFFYNQ